jgi:hypothetical protein
MRFGTSRQAPAPAPIASRLLPLVIGEERLEALDRVRVLDFGSLNRLNLDYFGSYCCRLQVVDTAHTLIEHGFPQLADLDEAEAEREVGDVLASIFSGIGAQRFDVVLLWDTVNLLPDAALAAFFRRLREHLHDGFAGHGFMMHRREPAAGLRDLGIVDQTALQCLGEQNLPVHLHNRKQLNESMSPLHVKHGVLHGDGRLEFVFV